jgi:hypothetical protein
MKRATAGLTGAIALLACVAGLSLSPAALAAPSYQKESEAEFQRQLSAGLIREAIINKHIRTVRITLTDGSRWLARYPPKQEPRVRSELRSKGVRVTVLTPTAAKAEEAKKPVHVHHKLRYIALGIVIAVIVVVGGVLMYNRRRRAD